MIRCLKGSITSFEDLIEEIKEKYQAKPNKTVLIGIDGCGGSGKSTFADNLLNVCKEAVIVHMDDFYLPSCERSTLKPEIKETGGDFDWKRVIAQVLEPLYSNNRARYQKYNWITDKLDEWIVVEPEAIVLLEGVYSTRDEFRRYLDFKIWIECSRGERLKRGLERDGEDSRETWENNWMVQEDRYVNTHRPKDAADYIFDCEE